MDENYEVVVGKYAERHYIKKFKKSYKLAWDKTWEAIEFSAARIDTFVRVGKAETIIDMAPHKVVKFDFAVVGTKVSPRASGRRCIFVVNEEQKTCTVVLVYHKDDIGARGGETATWKRMIRENYLEYRDLC